MDKKRIEAIKAEYQKQDDYAWTYGDNNSRPPEYVPELIEALEQAQAVCEKAVTFFQGRNRENWAIFDALENEVIRWRTVNKQ